MTARKVRDVRTYGTTKIYKVGDRISENRKSDGVRGKEYYQSDAFLDAQKEARFKASSARDELSKVEASWEMQSTLKDIERMSELEEAISKKMFGIGLSIESRREENLIYSSLNHLGYDNIFNYHNATDLSRNLDNRNLILSSFEYSNGIDGRQLNRRVQDFNFESNNLLNHCIVSGYGSHQATNLRSVGIDVFKYIMKNEDPELIVDALNSLIRGYYSIYLAEIIFGKEKAVEFRSRQFKIQHNLDTLEKIAAKHRFRILVIEDEVELAVLNVDRLKSLGFTNINVSPSIEKAINRMSERNYDLILSDYRLEDGSANKIYDYIEDQEFSKRSKPEFVIITGYEDTEVMHLRKKGIRIYDKVDTDNVEVIAKGCYVRKIRNLLNDLG